MISTSNKIFPNPREQIPSLHPLRTHMDTGIGRRS